VTQILYDHACFQRLEKTKGILYVLHYVLKEEEQKEFFSYYCYALLIGQNLSASNFARSYLLLYMHALTLQLDRSCTVILLGRRHVR